MAKLMPKAPPVIKAFPPFKFSADGSRFAYSMLKAWYRGTGCIGAVEVAREREMRACDLLSCGTSQIYRVRFGGDCHPRPERVMCEEYSCPGSKIGHRVFWTNDTINRIP